MDIKEKQARWAKEKPLFEAEFIHSHLLPFFNFNENTGDYEIKVESIPNTDDEDRKVAYESLNTGWAMWLRAKRNTKAQAVPESNALLSVAMDAVQKLGSGDFVLVKKVKLIEIIGAIAIIEPITRGNPYMDFVKRELNVIGNIANTAIKAQEQSHD